MKEKELRDNMRLREGIETLNPMQEDMLRCSSEHKDIILLSPTGSGKTVAFLLPLFKMLKSPAGRVQAIIIAPSRELVTQIARVATSIGGDYRTVALYGGHKVEDEVNSLKNVPDIIVATPGRLLDHAVRGNVELLPVRILVLDEFDKSLELGFEDEMSRIVKRMKNVSRFLMTSATDTDVLPEFLNLQNPHKLNYLSGNRELMRRMQVRTVRSEEKDKLEALLSLLTSISTETVPERSIIFVNHRESAERVYKFLISHQVDAVLYHGALEQTDRETALALFNSGARPILVATDLAARGLDIRDVRNVIHYHQPLTAEAYTHRNGRTARVADNGDVYILLGPDEQLSEFVGDSEGYSHGRPERRPLLSRLQTLRISAGKRDKLSKGDILGFLTKQTGLTADKVGRIEVFDHYSLVAVDAYSVPKILTTSGREKIKGQKQKFTIIN